MTSRKPWSVAYRHSSFNYRPDRDSGRRMNNDIRYNKSSPRFQGWLPRKINLPRCYWFITGYQVVFVPFIYKSIDKGPGRLRPDWVVQARGIFHNFFSSLCLLFLLIYLPRSRSGRRRVVICSLGCTIGLRSVGARWSVAYFQRAASAYVCFASISGPFIKVGPYIGGNRFPTEDFAMLPLFTAFANFRINK